MCSREGPRLRAFFAMVRSRLDRTAPPDRVPYMPPDRVPYRYWPCSSNSVRLGSSSRELTRVDGLRASAGVLATGPVESVYFFVVGSSKATGGRPRTARIPTSFATQATPYPALIPREVAGNPRRHPRIPARPSSKDRLAAGIPAYPCSARKRQDRPVTPEVAGSSPVAPVKTFCKSASFVADSAANDRRLPKRSPAHPAG
jgi:hypothetical protein